MGGKSRPRVEVPDPQEIIRAEMEANRFNTSGPFGSTQWQGNTQVTNLSPEMQAGVDRLFDLAGRDAQRIETPDFLNTLAGGMMSRVGEQYGVGGKPGATQNIPQPGRGAGLNPRASAPDFNSQAMQIRQMLDRNPRNANRRPL